MSIWITSMEEFMRRKNLVATKQPNHPIRWYDATDRYLLYWTDIDGQVMAAEKEKSSFQSREAELTFLDPLQRDGLKLLAPYGEMLDEVFTGTTEIID